LKYIVYLLKMIILKKIIIGIFFINFLAGCVQSTALLGPIYTLGTTGNTLQAGLSYGSNKAISKITGKTTSENVKEILEPNANDSELRELLKKRIIEVRKKLKNIQKNKRNIN